MNYNEPQPTPIEVLVALYKKHNSSSLDINHLVCKTCNNWLAEPIYLTPSGHHACGTCTNATEDDCIRDVSLEHLLKGTKYPCKFSAHGCKVFDALIEPHENTCNYSVWCFCHMFVATKQGLRDHLEDKHSAISVELSKPIAEFAFEPFDKVEEKYIPFYLHVGETELLARIYKLSSMGVHNLNLSVYNLGLPRDIKFTLKVTYNDAIYIKYGKVSNKLWDDLGTTVLSIPIEKQVVNSRLTVKIYFDDYENFEQSEKIFQSMIEEYECPVCLETITEYCYQCINGHNICKPCKNKLTICPLCRLEINQCVINIRNLTAQFQRMCKYSSNGCFVHNNVQEIRDHEKLCPMKLTTCNVCRDLTFNKIDFINHMLTEHKMQVLQSMPMKVSPGYIFYEGCVYKLNFIQTLGDVDATQGGCDMKVSWSLTVIDGPTKNISRLYKLDIDVGGSHLIIDGVVQDGDKMQAISFHNIERDTSVLLALSFVDKKSCTVTACND